MGLSFCKKLLTEKKQQTIKPNNPDDTAFFSEVYLTLVTLR